MAEVDPLILELRADIKAFGRNLSEAQSISENRLGAIEARGVKMGQRLKGGFDIAKGAAAGFIATLGVDAVIRSISTGLQYAASLQEVATQLGVTTDALQEYRYAGTQAGLSTEEVDLAITQLTRRIGEAASGTKAQAEAFEKLGVSVRDAGGNIVNAGDAIPQIADALKKIESPAERAAILMDLFGRSGQKLEPLLAGGAKGVNNLRDAAQKLGIVLSQDQIAKADETADKLDALKQVLSANIAGAVADNADSILELANALVTVVGSIGGFIKEYRRLREEFAIGFQSSAGKILSVASPGNIGLSRAFTESAQRRRGQAESARLRGGFADIDIGKPKASSRSNLVAQGPDIFDDFRANQISPALGAAAAKQATALGDRLTEGEQELTNILSEIFSIATELVGTAEARLENEKFQIQIEKAQSVSRINSNESLNATQREQALLGVEQIALGKTQLAEDRAAREAAQKAESDAAALADIETRNAVEALEHEYDMARSNAERLRIALAIVDAESESALAAIDRQLLDEEIEDAKRDELNAIRAGIEANRDRATQNATRDNQGALSEYLDDLKKLDFDDEAEKFGVEAIKDLNSGIADAIVNGKKLGDVLENTGKRFIAQLLEIAFQLLVIKPLMESLGQAPGASGQSSGGLGGFFQSILGGLGGALGTPKASGGPVSAGKIYRVNESQREFFQPSQNGKILTMSQMRNQMVANGSGQSGGLTVVRLELSGDIRAEMKEQSAGIAVQVVQAAAPQIRDSAVSETFRRVQRPGLGR